MMTNRLNHLLILTIALMLLGISTAAATELINLGPEQAKEAIANTPDIVILDIRTPDEYRAGHIKDSKNIDFYGPDFQQIIDALDKSAPYFIYCRSGRRSGVTIKYMEKTGFKKILHLEKGVNSWKGAGLPLER